MLAAAAAALLVSVLAVIMGGPARDLAAVPWVVLAVAAAVDMALSLAFGRSLKGALPAEIFVGETAELVLSLARAPRGVAARLGWPDGLTGPDEISFTPGADGVAYARVPVRAVRRGKWRIGEIWLMWRSRFGLFEFVPRLKVDIEAAVIPNVRIVQSGQITTQVMSTLYGMKENRAIGDGSEFHQLRDFVAGMDVKTVDWKRSARKRSLVSKELRAERNHHVILALDNGYLMREEIDGLPKIDHATTAALAVAWAAAIGGDLVGYYSYDVRPRSFVVPAPGRIAFARMRSWSAGLDYVGRETNHTLALSELNARTPKRSLIVVFTDFVDTTSAELLVENMRILAKRHLMLFVALRDPDLDDRVASAPQDLDGVARLVAANQSLAERRLVLERLSRLGVTVIDARPAAVTARLVSAYLDIKARDMI